MTRAAPPATTLVAGLCIAGLACLALVTLASPATTRMFAWPWTLGYAGALLAPALLLVGRALDPRDSFTPPSRSWLRLAGAAGGVVLVAAIASPYRGSSVLASAPLLSGVGVFLVLTDWLQREPTSVAARRDRLRGTALIACAILGAMSMGLWLEKAARVGVAAALAGRNAFPLGHSNYVAGAALLMLPLAAAATFRCRGARRALAALTGALALGMLLTSGSRGGLLGLAAVAAATLGLAPLAAKRKALLAAAAVVGGLGFLLVNPRTRTMVSGANARAVLATSDVQRSAMLLAGGRLGAARPLLGWGPGTTPLAYPRFRGGLDGGAENVLQLHSTPVQVWAELGAAGVACVLAFGLLVFRHRARDPVAAITLAGYATFALTDWQLDVPFFAAAIAVFAALLAPPAAASAGRGNARVIGAATLGALAAVALLGRRDPTPEWNVRALALARDPAEADRAIVLLRASLALNPDQEIAHFNLGWLLVVRDPAAAERHFRAAAHLVPDKGGVYFGLGLARLNHGQRAAAAQAFALECLNDPRFLTSPWWRLPDLSAVRDATAGALAGYLAGIRAFPAAAQIDPALLGRVPDGPERTYRRERTGYPVLMRNLDLPSPVDLYDVREATAADALKTELPPKGWLPSPLLLGLLDRSTSLRP